VVDPVSVANLATQNGIAVLGDAAQSQTLERTMEAVRELLLATLDG